MKKATFSIVFAFLLITFWGTFSLASAQKKELEKAIGYRLEILVYSCQMRVIKITGGGHEQEYGIFPAVTAENDELVLFDVTVPVLQIVTNPPWNPTPRMLRDPSERKLLKPFKGGQEGNPLGELAMYLGFKNQNFRFVRIHVATEMPQRELLPDENGNLVGYRESSGCVRVSFKDLLKCASDFSGLKEDSIQQTINTGKTRKFKIKIPVSVIFMRK